jgi:hypothetical protein
MALEARDEHVDLSSLTASTPSTTRVYRAPKRAQDGFGVQASTGQLKAGTVREEAAMLAHRAMISPAATLTWAGGLAGSQPPTGGFANPRTRYRRHQGARHQMIPASDLEKPPLVGVARRQEPTVGSVPVRGARSFATSSWCPARRKTASDGRLSQVCRTVTAVTRGGRGRGGVPQDRSALPKVTKAQVLAVRCPRCLAKVGEACHSADGKTLSGGHQQRRLSAQRAAYRAGQRPGAPLPTKPLSPEAEARREEYARQQESRKAARPDSSPERRVDERGRRIVPASKAVTRSGRHKLRVDDGLPRSAPSSSRSRAPSETEPPPRRPVRPAPTPRFQTTPRTSSGLAERLPPPDPAWGEPRLPAELIPTPLWGQSGKKLLSRADWDKVRHRVYDLAGHRCEVCGDVGTRHAVEAAERWSYDDDLLVQTLVGVTALCPTCHAATTPGRAAWLARTQPDLYADLPERLRTHLATMNDWSSETTDAYLRWSFQVHALRSEYDGWTSDWSYFARTYGVGDGVLSTERVCSRCFLAGPARLFDDSGVCAACR